MRNYSSELLTDLNTPLLLRKLQHLGFNQNAIDLIKNYFTDRNQYVNYDNYTSTKSNVNLGVPQGSILGPLFFSLFINDLALYMTELKKKLFADDTTFYRSAKDSPTLINEFQHHIKPLLEWCSFNKLDLNWSKTFFMFIKNKRFKYPNSIDVYGNNIIVVNSFKLLGVTLDDKLTFNDFVNITKKSVNTKLYSIRRLFYLANSVKIQFFKTFILPYSLYILSKKNSSTSL